MSKIIKFIAQDDHVWNVRPKPYPAAKGIPDWWKDIPVYSGNGFDVNPASTVTVKRCIPTLDMMSAGYYVPLWADIFVKKDNGKLKTKWTTRRPVAETWSKEQVSSFKIPEGYNSLVFKNLHGWTIKTPPGWSCLFIHPPAYEDMPFYTIPGIVDTDVFDGEINIPFVIKDDFEGIIERGTPMFQVIPFKREKWEAEFDVKKPNQHFFDNEKLYAKIERAYQALLKDKKIYR